MGDSCLVTALRRQLAPLIAPEHGSGAADILSSPLDSHMEIAPEIRDRAKIDLIVHTHELMREYSEERLQRPLESALAADFLGRYVSLAESFLTHMDSTDVAGLVDALTVLRCLHAVKFSDPELPEADPAHVPLLLGWTQQADSGWSPERVEIALEAKPAHTSTLFWQYVTECVVSGRLSDAHSAINSAFSDTWAGLDSPVKQALSGFLQLLHTYPSAGISAFKSWRRAAINLRTEAEALPSEWRAPLTHIASIMHGNSLAILRASEYWYTAVGALFMFSEPAIDLLEQYFDTAAAKLPVDLSLDWEEACAAIFRSNMISALKLVERLDSLSGLVAVELCHQQGLLQYPFGLLTLREFFAIIHSVSLLGSPTLIRTGLDMLENMATPIATRVLAAVLPLLAAHSPEAAAEAQALAEQLDLPETVRTLHVQAAIRNQVEGNYVEAILEYYLSGDELKMRDTTWEVFEKCLLAGTPVGQKETLDILRDPEVAELELPMTVKSCLAPMAVLVNLLDALPMAREGDPTAASQALKYTQALLTFPSLPAKYYPLLVAIVSGVDLGSTQVTRHVVYMMSALTSWEASPEKDEGLELLQRSRGKGWGTDIDPAYSPVEVVWMLRRQLANDAIAF